MSTPKIAQLDLSDSDSEDLFASPTKPSKTSQKPNPRLQEGGNAQPRNGESKYDAEQARDDALKRELEGVRSINEVIEGVVASLAVGKGNMDNVSQTVTSASTLLNTWIRILSQTEHNQRLILNPNWNGAAQDLADIETETVLKAQAAERRAAEEERRRQEAKQRAEDEERQRQAGTQVRGARGSRGRGRGRGRATGSGSVYGPGYVTGGGSNSTPASSRGSLQMGRAGSGIGRGTGSVRGRPRGTR